MIVKLAYTQRFWLHEVSLHWFRSGFQIPPQSNCTEALGAGSGKISDNAFRASSVWDNNHGAAHARLNKVQRQGLASSWSARVNDDQQWLQIDLGRWKSVTRVATQGRHDRDQWVTSYTVSYSLYGGHFDFYKENDQIKVGLLLKLKDWHHAWKTRWSNLIN